MVDESDKLFEAGRQGFRDQLGAIYRACDSTQIRRAFFSATFAHDVDQWYEILHFLFSTPCSAVVTTPKSWL